MRRQRLFNVNVRVVAGSRILAQGTLTAGTRRECGAFVAEIYRCAGVVLARSGDLEPGIASWYACSHILPLDGDVSITPFRRV